MLRSNLFRVAVAFTATSAAAPFKYPRSEVQTPEIQQVYTFNGIFLENIAVTQDGALLLTTLSRAEVYILDPTEENPSPSILATFPSPLNGITGIVEIAEDIFAVSVGNWSIGTARGNGFELWTINITSLEQPEIQRAAVLSPEFAAVNGLTRVGNDDGLDTDYYRTVLFSESAQGAIYNIDLNCKGPESKLVLQDDESMGLLPNGSINLGINGLRVSADGESLVWANSAKKSIWRVDITEDGFLQDNAHPDLIASFDLSSSYTFDDLALASDGGIYVATHSNAVFGFNEDGYEILLAGGGSSTDLGTVGPTSCAFGRGSEEEAGTLYIVGSDGLLSSINVEDCQG